MFLNRRSNYLDDTERILDSFFDHDEFFSSFQVHDDLFLTKEDQLRKSLSMLHHYENQIHHNVKIYENQIEQFKKAQEQILKKKAEINEKLSQLPKERPEETEHSQKKDPASQAKIFKRVQYKTNDMEIEEQYDSTNPQNCYKIIKKQGGSPQLVSGNENAYLTNTNNASHVSEAGKLEPLGDGNDDKFEQLCRLTGKRDPLLRTFVLENKDLTVKQLHDLAIQKKLV